MNLSGEYYLDDRDMFMQLRCIFPAIEQKVEAMKFDWEKLTVPDIEALIETAQQEIQHRKVTAKNKLKQEIENKLKESGLDLGDLFPVKTKKAKKSKKDNDPTPAPVKYRDPVSQGAWSGRGGRPPQWVKLIMIERRWSLEDFKESREYSV